MWRSHINFLTFLSTEPQTSKMEPSKWMAKSATSANSVSWALTLCRTINCMETWPFKRPWQSPRTWNSAQKLPKLKKVWWYVSPNLPNCLICDPSLIANWSGFPLRFARFSIHLVCKSIVERWRAICPAARRSVYRLPWNWSTIRRSCSSMNQHPDWTVPPVSNALICWNSWHVVAAPLFAPSINRRPVYSKCSINCTHCPMGSVCTRAAPSSWYHFWARWIWSVPATTIRPVISLKWPAVSMATTHANWRMQLRMVAKTFVRKMTLTVWRVATTMPKYIISKPNWIKTM